MLASDSGHRPASVGAEDKGAAPWMDVKRQNYKRDCLMGGLGSSENNNIKEIRNEWKKSGEMHSSMVSKEVGERGTWEKKNNS